MPRRHVYTPGPRGLDPIFWYLGRSVRFSRTRNGPPEGGHYSSGEKRFTEASAMASRTNHVPDIALWGSASSLDRGGARRNNKRVPIRYKNEWAIGQNGNSVARVRSMQQHRNESRHGVRPSWHLAVVAESQRLAGRAPAIDPDDAKALLTDFLQALPAPSSFVERTVLREHLIDVAWRSARTLHQRAHRGRPKRCAFDPAAALDLFWTLSPQHPEKAFRAWLDAFSIDFARAHPPSVAARVTQLIKQDYRQRWCLADLAKRFHVTASWLRRHFRREFGTTIHQYQQTLRVLAAMDDLGKDKVDPIALGVGFKSTKNFYRAFRRLTGLTPAAFRHLSSERAAEVVEMVRARSTARVGRP